MFSNPWVILGAVLALVGAFASGTTLGVKYQKGQSAREEVLIVRAAEAAQKSAAEAIAKIKVVNKTIQEEVRIETRDVPTYSTCRNSESALRLLNDALTGAKSEPVGRGELPGAGPAP